VDAPNVEAPAPMTPEEQAATDAGLEDTLHFVQHTLLHDDGTPKSLDEISYGDLLLVAQKLGIKDPLNDPETLQELIDSNTDLANAAMEAAKGQDRIAAEENKKAQEQAGIAKAISTVVTVVMIVAAVVMAAFIGPGAVALVAVAIAAGAAIGAGIAA